MHIRKLLWKQNLQKFPEIPETFNFDRRSFIAKILILAVPIARDDIHVDADRRIPAATHLLTFHFHFAH